MRKLAAQCLRRAAQRLDPQPAGVTITAQGAGWVATPAGTAVAYPTANFYINNSGV